MPAYHPTRVQPSHLAYLKDLHLVEERQGRTRLYPHTDQLPSVYNAIQREFLAGIPARLAKTDHRADDRRKHALDYVMEAYCQHFNATCEDQLAILPYYTPDGVAQLAVVQQIISSEADGAIHRYRFFVGKQFLPSVYLSGKAVAFVSHVLDRFQERVTQGPVRNYGEVLRSLFASPVVHVRANDHGQALAAEVHSLLFPFRETEEEILFTTCLTVHEVRQISSIEPPRRFFFHYGRDFQQPTSAYTTDDGIRRLTSAFIRKWNNRQIFDYQGQSPVPEMQKMRGWATARKTFIWHHFARQLVLSSDKHWPPNGRWRFLEEVYGPCMMAFMPRRNALGLPEITQPAILERS